MKNKNSAIKTVKIICIACAAALVCTAAAWAATPSDEQLADLKAYKIMVGDENGDLRLDETITRAEAVKMICAAGGIEAVTPEESPFLDVDESHWAYGFICAAKENGIVSGGGDGCFNPEDNVTNEELVKMAVELVGYGEQAEMTGGYPAGYTFVASRNGLTDGVMLETGAAAVRADAAVIFANALDVPLMTISDITDSHSEEYVISEDATLRDALENQFAAVG